MNILRCIKIKIIRLCIRLFKFPKIYKVGKIYKVASVKQTVNSLIDNNKSLSRFGDGELELVIDKGHVKDPSNNVFTFERESNTIRNKLIKVLTSTNPNLEIGLSPLSEAKDKHYTIGNRRALKMSMCELGTSWMKYLHVNRRYYNTNVTRAYSLYKHYSYSKYIFNQLKKIWNNKSILIVEGEGTRLGVGNDLFKNSKSIHRIECPSLNAFESYPKILKNVLNYLENHPTIDMSILALGPSATILAFDLCNQGFRALDVGHIDMEYEWFLRKKICDIPYKCVNEIPGGQKVTPIHDSKYINEIVKYIK